MSPGPLLGMLDFSRWIARATSWTESLPRRVGGSCAAHAWAEPPMAVSDLRTLEAELQRSLPEALAAFLTTGSGGCTCHFWWEPCDDRVPLLASLYPAVTRVYGGATLCDSRELPHYRRDALEWSRETWISDLPAQAYLWEASIPVSRLENGDFVALSTAGGLPDPPVVYLSHHDESRQISPSFTAFLSAWERLCYIGPESWMLEPFLTDGGELDITGEPARTLRRLFGSEEM